MLFRKMLRDMWGNKAQFLSILLMTLIGIYIYSGVTSEYKGLEKTVNDFYQETNLADSWIYSSGFSKEAEDQVAAIDGITGVERRFTLKSICDLENKPTVVLHFVEGNHISTAKLMKGEEFSIDKEGIWLDITFANARNLKVGDYLQVNINKIPFKQKIMGLIMSPEYVYSEGENDVIPTPGSFGYAYLSYKTFPKELPLVFTDLMVTASGLSDSQLEDAIAQKLDGKYSVYISRNNMRSFMQFSEEMKEHKAIGQIFPILFLAVAILTTVTTMTRLANNQRTQIGILKAIGFKRRTIMYHYISYGLWISLAGTALGAILGPLTLPYLFYKPMMTTYKLPEWRSAIPISIIFMILLSITCSTLATYLTCRKLLKDTPSESLRPKAPKHIRHSFIDRSRIWAQLSFDTQWNFRDLLRCKGRSLMAVFGILGCSALLICAFGMQDTFYYIIKWNYEILNCYETKMELMQGIDEKKYLEIQKQYRGEAILEGAVELKSDSGKRSGEMLVMDQVSLIQFVDASGNPVDLPKDQLAISYKIAELLKLKVGDKVSWHVYGEEKWNMSRIGAIYRTPFTQGIAISKDFYESYGYRFTPTALLTAKTVHEDLMDDASGSVVKIQDRDKLIESIKTMTEAMNVMVFVLMIAAIILAAVVIYNLGVLSFAERQREMSTLKVIGFQTKKLRSLLLKQNIWLTIIGIVPGIPQGIWILRYIFNFVGEVFDFIIVIRFQSYLYCIFGTLLISILINRLFSKRVKKIDMVSSLKGVE